MLLSMVTMLLSMLTLVFLMYTISHLGYITLDDLLALNMEWVFLKGNMHTISPGRNRVNFQILAYLLTIYLLTLWHWMLIILILLLHATTRQQ